MKKKILAVLMAVVCLMGSISVPQKAKASVDSTKTTVPGITGEVEVVTSLSEMTWAENRNFSTTDKGWITRSNRASHEGQVLKVEEGDVIQFKDSARGLYFYMYGITEDSIGHVGANAWDRIYTVEEGVQYLLIVVRNTNTSDAEWPEGLNQKDTSDYLTITRKSCDIEHPDNNGDGKCDNCGYKEGSVKIPGITNYVEVVKSLSDLDWAENRNFSTTDKGWITRPNRASHEGQVLEVEAGDVIQFKDSAQGLYFYMYGITEDSIGHVGVNAWDRIYTVEEGVQYLLIVVRNTNTGDAEWPEGFNQKDTSDYLTLIKGSHIKVESVQMEITDSLALNFEVEVPEGENPKIIIDGPGVDVQHADMTLKGDVWTYQYSDIRAQEMNEELTITVKTESVYRTFKYSVMKYCMNLLAMEDEEFAEYTTEQIAAIRELVVDLVQYGASLQKYRGEDDVLLSQIGDKISYDLNNNVTSLANLTPVTPLSEAQSDSYKWTDVTLVLKEKVNIRAKFSAENIEGLTVQVAVGNNEPVDAKIISAGSNQYYVYFDGICANQYDEMVTFTFMKEGQKVEATATLKYSVNTYLKVASEHDSTRNNANLIALLNAINEYGQAAKNVANNG